MEWPVVEGGGTRGRLEYVCADVRDQKAMWRVGEEIGDREGRMDVCVAAAGILKAHRDCLEYPGEEFEEVRCCFFLSFFLSFFLWKGEGRGICATDMVVKGSLILIVVLLFFVR
jgi:NAD(P)-dependent dehydrogenase (short-subunit alcohol dehydrogenase family)